MASAHRQFTDQHSKSPERESADGRRLVWLAFGVMTTLIAVTVAAMYWACTQEVAAFQRGLDMASREPAGPVTYGAISAFASGVMAAYTKTISVLLSFLLIFAGTVYVLLPLKAKYKGTAEGGGNRGTLESDSPGLIMITLGVFLAAVAVLHQVSVDYKMEAARQDGVVVTSPGAPVKAFEPGGRK
jgi:uncharacterized membrane protein